MIKLASPLPTKDEIDALMKEGGEACRTGLHDETNPYARNSEEHRLWHKGFHNARLIIKAG